jgi:hypothetical protein
MYGLWHDGRAVAAHGGFPGELGTDAGGRGVGVRVDCRTSCEQVEEQVLPDGPVSTPFTAPSPVWTIDESRGDFLLGLRASDGPQGIFLRDRDDGMLRRISRLRPGRVSISTGAMTNQSKRHALYAAGRDRPHRWPLIARSNGNVRGTADGRFAYWLQDDEQIMRLNPGRSHRHVDVFGPPRLIRFLAVTHGTLYYTDRDTGDLYEYRHPPFVRSGRTVPVD